MTFFERTVLLSFAHARRSANAQRLAWLRTEAAALRALIEVARRRHA